MKNIKDKILRIINNKNYKRIAIIVILFALIFGFYKSLSNSNKELILVNNKIDRRQFQIYKQKEDGSGYELYTGSGFPYGQKINIEMSICVDNNSNELQNVISFVNGKVSVTSNKTVFCTLYFDLSGPDITVITTGYTETHNTKSVNCTTGETPQSGTTNAYFNTKYQALVFNNVNSYEANCTLTSSNTDLSSTKTTLKDTITGLITSGNIYEHQTEGVTDWVLEYLPNEAYEDYDNATKIESAGYNLISEFYKTGTFDSGTTSSSNGSVTPPDVSLSWDDTNKYWISDLTQSSLTDARTYYYFFRVTEAGYYEVCYKKESGGTNDRLYLYKGSNNVLSSASFITISSTSESCFEYGLLTTSDTIKIGHYTPSSDSTKMDIYIKKAIDRTIDAGYRYEGKKPNNYIWFNNEMWRIIGVIPTCTSSGCSTSENLVKIIRAESIGGLRWDRDSGGSHTWSSTTLLYQILNEYYLTKGNATGKAICTGTVAADCDYRVKGIGETTYYGSMIKNVYWNTGEARYGKPAITVYGGELNIQNVGGKIGIMNASDYGYATTNHSLNLSSYGSYASTNWLYGQGYEWTITPYKGSLGNVFHALPSGAVGTIRTVHSAGYAVRPALYLDSSVYVVSGDGSESNPYQIAV